MASREEVAQKIGWALMGSFVDVISRAFPNHFRPSEILLESVVDGSHRLEPIKAHNAAIYPDDGTILIDPGVTNLCSWNVDLGQGGWITGSNVNLRANIPRAPDNRFHGDIVTWTGGSGGASQSLQREFKLQPSSWYTWSVYLQARPSGGLPGSKDVLRFSGDIEGGTIESRLSQLNNSVGKWQLLTMTFKTSGTIPNANREELDELIDFEVTNVTATTVRLSFTIPISVDALVGAIIQFSNLSNDGYEIVGNTATSSNEIIVSVAGSTLVSDGVTTTSKASIVAPGKRTVKFEAYSESTLSLNWGGCQLSPGKFHAPMIYQLDDITSRAPTDVVYLDSPVAALTSFGIFVDLRYWRGDGAIADSDNFAIWLQDGYLYASANDTSLSTPNPIPQENVKFFVQWDSGANTLSIYLNGILVSTTSISNFIAADSTFDLSSTGVRAIRRMLVATVPLIDGNPSLGMPSREEVELLFKDENLLSSSVIASELSGQLLPPLKIKATTVFAKSAVTAIDTANRRITLRSKAGFVINKTIATVRDGRIKSRHFVTAIDASNPILTLSDIAGIQQGDAVIYGDLDNPGRASARYPFDAIDPLEITGINGDWISVSSTLEFTRGRAIVTSRSNQDVAGVIIKEVDFAGARLRVDRINNIEVGHIIGQPASEVLIHPRNALISFLDADTSGIEISRIASDSIEIINRNFVPVITRLLVTPNL